MSKIYESKYTIVEELEAPLKNFKYIILNSFSGSIDIIGKSVLDIFNLLRVGKYENSYRDYLDFFIKRGYFYLEQDEERKKIKAIKQASDRLGRFRLNPRVVILTTYECNLNCTYCYQKSIKRNAASISSEKIKKFFEYIGKTSQESNSSIVIDVIGGEPLLNKESHRKTIHSIIDGCEKRAIKFRLISNGVNLVNFVDILSKTNTLEFVQITIDGPPLVQIKRRGKYGHNYIERLKNGINLSLEKGIRIAARTNIDTENISGLKDLYGWYTELGWINRKEFFPYVSPVHDYTCNSCSSTFEEYQILFRLLEYEDLYPDIMRKFNKSNFLSYQYLKNPLTTKSFTFPRYYRCEANVNQLVFDPEGLLYTCIEAAGHNEYSVGRYFPDFQIKSKRLKIWHEDRNVINLGACLECEICFICGGNCAWGAFNISEDLKKTQCSTLKKSIRLLLKRRGHLLISSLREKQNN